MDTIHIRKSSKEDAPAIFRLNCEEMGYPNNLDKTCARLQAILQHPQHCVLVATCNSLVVGYIHASNYDLLYYEPVKNILGIAVNGEYKRKGIGRALLTAIEEWAKQDGAAGVRLVSGSARKDAHLFYSSCGYLKNKQQLNFAKTFIHNE